MRQGETKYIILVNWIRERILSGEFRAGEKLYSENRLSEMFDLSRQTVRHSIGILEKEGMVERVRGSGTYVGSRRETRRKRTMNIAIISTYVDGYIFPSTLRGIVQASAEAGYLTQISFTNNRVDHERKILEGILKKDNVDGVIVEAATSALPNPNLSCYRELQSRGIALLFFNCVYPGLNAPLVAMDDRAIAEDAVNYLLREGHRKIAGIFKADDGQGRLRYEGYMNALLDAGIWIDERNVLWIDTEDMKDLKLIRNSLMRRLSGCTAAFCYNDEVAFGVMDILRREGIKIPGQFSLVSIDGTNFSQISEPQITSVPYPMGELGKKAAENLIRLIQEPNFNGNYLFRPELKIGGSVKKIGGGGEA